jgi:ribosomal-protein-alanine N-acetyltransferase
VTTTVPRLITERLVLTLPTHDDAEALLDYARRNREHLARFGPPEPRDGLSLDYWLRRVTSIHSEFEAQASVRFTVFRSAAPGAEVIGGVSLSCMVFGPLRNCIMGYHLDQREQGKGLMSEAVRAVVSYGFDELKLHRISANYMPTNERSGRLLKRLGFQIEGYARDYLFTGVEWSDHVLTALTNPTPVDWAELCGG